LLLSRLIGRANQIGFSILLFSLLTKVRSDTGDIKKTWGRSKITFWKKCWSNTCCG